MDEKIRKEKKRKRKEKERQKERQHVSPRLPDECQVQRDDSIFRKRVRNTPSNQVVYVI